MAQLQKQAPAWTQKLETAVLVGMIVINLVVTLLDFLGVLDEIDWLSARVPVLILLSTVAIAAYLLLERRHQLQTMQEESSQRLDELTRTIATSTSTIIDSLNGVEFQKYDNGHDLLRYVNTRLYGVRQGVDDLSWSGGNNLGLGLALTQQLTAEHTQRIDQVSRDKQYREVYMFNRPGRIGKLKQRLEENAPGYSCGYYEKSHIPLLQFMIIDQEEIIVLIDEFPAFLAIRHSGLIKLFTDYYEAIWNNAIKIKEGPVTHQEIVEQVFERYG